MNLAAKWPTVAFRSKGRQWRQVLTQDQLDPVTHGFDSIAVFHRQRHRDSHLSISRRHNIKFSGYQSPPIKPLAHGVERVAIGHRCIRVDRIFSGPDDHGDNAGLLGLFRRRMKPRQAFGARHVRARRGFCQFLEITGGYGSIAPA